MEIRRAAAQLGSEMRNRSLLIPESMRSFTKENLTILRMSIVRLLLRCLGCARKLGHGMLARG